MAALPAPLVPDAATIDDVRLDEPGGQRRGERERRDGRVAAGDGDPLGAAERRRGRRAARADRTARCRRARSRRTAVQASASVEPEVRAAVDDEHVVAERLGDRGRRAVRQGQEHHVVTGERLGVGGLEDPLGQRREVRLEGAERLPRVAGAGERADLDARVPEQQAQQLAAGVPARSGHRCSYLRHVHDYT